MMQYLQRHTRLDILFSVSQYNRCIHRHTDLFIMSLKILEDTNLILQKNGHYLKPTFDLTIDSHVDVDFARLLNQKDHNEDNCFKSRTGCVLCFSSCPVLWINRFQDGIGIYT
jgi:hypothetical protein